MALIQRTVGSGGDYATWNAAWTFLQGLGGPMADDYEFEQISNIAETAAWPGTLQNAGGPVRLNGHYIRIYCPFANSHQGNPNQGYRTNVNGDIELNMSIGSTAPDSGYISVENLHVRRVAGNSAVRHLLRVTASQFAAASDIAYTANCLVVGSAKGDFTGIGDFCFDPGVTIQYSRFVARNLKLYFGSLGIGSNAGGAGPDIQTTPRTIENVTIYDCDVGMNASTELEHACTFRNVICIDCDSRDWSVGSVAAVHTIVNCGDSDGTLTAGTNNTTNIDSAASFESVDVVESDFLFLPEGTDITGQRGAAAMANPTRGRAPLEVQFIGSIDITSPEYDYSDSPLSGVGTTPVYSTEDIAGETYGENDEYPVGCHQAQIEA